MGHLEPMACLVAGEPGLTERNTTVTEIPVESPDYAGQSIDLTKLNDAALDELRHDVVVEQEKRYVVANAEQQARDLNERYTRAIGREDGAEWVQPTGAHDAYRINSEVTHDGKTWISTTPANVWEPGVSGWREKPSVDPDTGEESVPEFVPPTGGHDAYKIGDRVTFEGKVWESGIDGNVWSPADHAAGWKLIG